jgi:osmotically-inducible protein OsmY
MGFSDSPATRGRVSAVAVALLLSAIVAEAAGPGGSATSDLQILGNVAAAVNAYPHFTVFDDVEASARDGAVTLTGKVTMGYKREEIEKRVAAVAGVRRVVNEITVLPASTFDDALREQIARAIYGNSNFRNYAVMPHPSIHIVVERSHVTLTGVVRSDVDRRLAQALATQFGALSVTNRLTTNDEHEPRN